MDLERLRTVVWRHRIVVGLVFVIGLVAAVLSGHRPKTYSADSAVILVNAANAATASQTDTTRLTVQIADLPTLLQSAIVLKGVEADLHHQFSIGTLSSSVKARATESSIMPISYTARTPEAAIDGANAFADELTSYYRTISTARFDLLIHDLERQVAARKAQIADYDQRLSNAAASDLYIDSKTGGTTVNAELVALQDKRDALAATLRGDAASAGTLDTLLQAVRPLATTELSESDPAFQKIAAQAATDRAALAHTQATFSSKYPGLPELLRQNAKEADQVAVERQRIDNSAPAGSKSYANVLGEKMAADARVQSDQAELEALNAEFQTLSSRATTTRGNNVLVSQLRLERDSAESAYTLLTTRLAAALADRSEAASIGSIAVIDRATAATPSSSSGNLLGAIVCIAIFSWLAIALAYQLEAYSGRGMGRSSKRVEEFYGAPVFTVIGS